MTMRPRTAEALRADLLDRLAGSAPDLATLPVVARTLASISITCPVLVHFTFDEPFMQDGEWRTLMTYHLADQSQCHDSGCRNEVRGCCLVAYVPGRTWSFSDADAEAFVIDEPRASLFPAPERAHAPE